MGMRGIVLIGCTCSTPGWAGDGVESHGLQDILAIWLCMTRCSKQKEAKAAHPVVHHLFGYKMISDSSLTFVLHEYVNARERERERGPAQAASEVVAPVPGVVKPRLEGSS